MTSVEASLNRDVETCRALIGAIISRIVEDGDGEVYAEDVNDIINGLGLVPGLFNKVAGTLEQIVNDTAIALAFKADPEWAWNKYYDDRYPGTDGVEYFQQYHEIEAERGIALLMGLAALSTP